MTESHNYGTRLADSIRRVGGWAFAVLISAVGLSPTQATVPLRWFWFAAGSLLIAALVLLDLSIRAHRDARNVLPRVVSSAPPGAYGEKGMAILLLAPSPLFSPETLVSIYLRRGKFEAFAGLGTVTTVQQDRRPQVLVTHIHESARDELADLKNNRADLLEALIVKPTVPISMLNEG